MTAIVTALLVGGCGGSDGSNSSASSISKEQFIVKADAVCEKGTERLQKAIFASLKHPRNLTKVSAAEQVKIVTTAMVPNVSREAKELRALGVPDGDEEKVDAMITALEEGVETAERDPQAVTKSSDAVFGISSRIAAEYGLKACSTR
ncbi:MAG: hypothetical protein ACLGG5_02115 [Thermoleophilia bacterium]